MSKKRRRGRGEGSVYQRDDGRWVGSVTVGYDPETRKQQRRVVYGKTKDEVLDKILELRQQIKAGLQDLSDTRVKVAMDLWLDGVVKHKTAPSTWDSYRDALGRHLYPLLGAVTLDQVIRNCIDSLP